MKFKQLFSYQSRLLQLNVYVFINKLAKKIGSVYTHLGFVYRHKACLSSAKINILCRPHFYLRWINILYRHAAANALKPLSPISLYHLSG